MKRLLMLFCCLLLGFGCAKRELVKPHEEAAQAAPTAGHEAALESSVRYSDWEKLPELKTVYFEFDKSELTADAREFLKENAEYMKSNSGLTFLVEGHCDERGTVEYNLALGQRRAAVVRQYYGKLGVPMTNIGTISYGSEKPIVPGTGEDVWAKNRRAETRARSRT